MSTLLTKHETANRLGISVVTLDRYVRKGLIPAVHPKGQGRGKRVLFDWVKVHDRIVCKACGQRKI